MHWSTFMKGREVNSIFFFKESKGGGVGFFNFFRDHYIYVIVWWNSLKHEFKIKNTFVIILLKTINDTYWVFSIASQIVRLNQPKQVEECYSILIA